jgi:hypothetical protein
MKLALILDKSSAFRDFQRASILKQWQSDTDVQRVNSLDEVGQETIFGNPPTAVMELDDISTVKKLVKDLESSSKNELNHKLQYGLVLVSGANRNSTKKLEQIVNHLGGRVILAKESSKDKSSVTTKLLSNLSLGRSEKRFLEDYVAEDYDSLLSLLRSLETLTPKQQSMITVADLMIRLPQPPGSIPPWEIEKPLMQGDVPETISVYRRIILHSHPLVVLSVLRNKIQLMWRIAALEHFHGITDRAQLSAVLSVSNSYALKLAQNMSRQLGLDVCQKLTELIAQAETDLKGGSQADTSVTMELLLVQIAKQVRK